MTEFTHNATLQAIADRLKRVETRMTAWMEFQGYSPQVTKPAYNHEKARIEIPNLDVRLRDLLETMKPIEFHQPLAVWHKGVVVMWVDRLEP
jgi:hypothetical protein